MQEKSTREDFLDTAKAIAILLVLVWHLRPFKINGNHEEWSTEIFQILIKLFYQQVTLIAVPLFIIVSLYLFFKKLDGQQDPLSSIYYSHRIRRLVALYISWTICQFVFFIGTHALQDILQGQTLSWHSFGDPILLLMNGGPPLPFVGGSVFYYLFVMICLTGLAFTFHLLLNKAKFPSIIVYGLIAILLFYFQIHNLNGKGLPYWRLDNFLVYIPIAYLISRFKHPSNKYYIAVLLTCYIVFVGQDIYITNRIGDTGAYTRLSVIFGSVALFSMLRIWVLKPPAKLLKFFAYYSLGIFAIHKYWQVVIIIFMKRYHPFPETMLIDTGALISAIFCIVLTCITVYLLDYTRFGWLVR